MNNTKSAKKRIMYLTGEDFYLYCYSVLIILDSLGCKNEKYFRDYRKLAFLTDIINNEKVVYVISKDATPKLNNKDYEHLLDSYSNGLTKRSEILKLLFVLEKKGYVILRKGKEHEIDVSICRDGIPKSFLGSPVFKSEQENIKTIAKKVHSLSRLKLESMLNKIYTSNGIQTWVH